MSEKAQALHRNAVVVVDHDHRPIGADIPLMLAGGVTAKVYQVTLDVDVEAGITSSVSRKDGWLRLAAIGMDEALRDIERHADRCLLARSVSDMSRARQEGRVAILLGAEGSRWLEGSLEPLRLFHRLGLRELQLTWAFPNQVVPDGRLSAFGREVVSLCNDLGVIVDVTHIPRQAFDEVIAHSRKPVIVSHGSARGVTTDLDDDQLRAIASTGGTLGIHFYTTYLGPDPKPEDVIRQVDYLAGLIGMEHIALGVDFFPTEGAWKALQVDQGTTDLRWAVNDMAQMPRITECLVNAGYGDENIGKILGGNFLRVCQNVFGLGAGAG
jgi:membrane dipeptidase